MFYLCYTTVKIVVVFRRIFNLNLKTFVKISNKWIKKEGEIDDRIQKARDNLEKFFSNISDIEDRVIVDKLIENFEYYSNYKINKFLKELYEKLIEINEGIEDTIFAFIRSDSGISNSSGDYWYEFKTLNNIEKYKCITNIERCKNWNKIKNIVFIDDFSGTGNSFIKEIEFIKNRKKDNYIFKNKKIYFLTIAIMTDAIKKIKEEAEKYNFEFYSISIKNMDKILEKKIFENSKKEIYKNNEEVEKRLRKLSEKLGISKHIMGYEGTQALVAFYNNTPNNTLGIFWEDTPKNRSLFPREKRHSPNPKTMNTDKKEKKRANYNSRVEENKNG